jgi:hypothetical protein
MGDKSPRSARYKETGDLAFAAYANMMGLKVVRAREFRKGYVTEYKFAFDDPPSHDHPDGRWDALQVDFANSESATFDNTVRTLKRLCKRSAENGR